jgi:WD40 repeat protein
VKAGKPQNGKVYPIQFHSSSKRLLVNNLTYGITLSDVMGELPPVELDGHASTISTAEFSPDGRLVLTASWDQTAILWDATSGAQAHVLRGHSSAVLHGTFNREGTIVATVSADKTCRLWDVRTGRTTRVLVGHEDQVLFANFSHDDDLILTISRDRSVRIWDIHDEDASPQIIREALPNVAIVQAEFAPADNRVLLIPGVPHVPQTSEGDDSEIQTHTLGIPPIPDSDFTVRILSTNGDELTALVHSEPLVAGAFDAEGQRVLTVAKSGLLTLWDARTGKELRCFESAGNPAECAAFAPNGRCALTQHSESVILWDLESGHPVLSVSDPLRRQVLYSSVAPRYRPFSPDGKWFAAVNREGEARIWHTDVLEAARRATPRSLTKEERARFEVFNRVVREQE